MIDLFNTGTAYLFAFLFGDGLVPGAGWRALILLGIFLVVRPPAFLRRLP